MKDYRASLEKLRKDAAEAAQRQGEARQVRPAHGRNGHAGKPRGAAILRA
jgi:hypothetical protein